MGKVSLDTGDYPAALAAYARGLALLETDEAGWTKELARMRLAYGRGLWDAPAQAGRDRGRARALVEQAREGFASLEAAQDLGDCERWLAEHG